MNKINAILLFILIAFDINCQSFTRCCKNMVDNRNTVNNFVEQIATEKKRNNDAIILPTYTKPCNTLDDGLLQFNIVSSTHHEKMYTVVSALAYDESIKQYFFHIKCRCYAEAIDDLVRMFDSRSWYLKYLGTVLFKYHFILLNNFNIALTSTDASKNKKVKIIKKHSDKLIDLGDTNIYDKECEHIQLYIFKELKLYCFDVLKNVIDAFWMNGRYCDAFVMSEYSVREYFKKNDSVAISKLVHSYKKLIHYINNNDSDDAKAASDYFKKLIEQCNLDSRYNGKIIQKS